MLARAVLGLVGQGGQGWTRGLVRVATAPESKDARAQVVRKLVAQREEFTQGRHRRRHFTPIEPGDQITAKILEYEQSARSNGQYKVSFKGDLKHTKRSVQRVLETNAGKWRAFKAQLNDSLAVLLENRR